MNQEVLKTRGRRRVFLKIHGSEDQREGTGFPEDKKTDNPWFQRFLRPEGVLQRPQGRDCPALRLED
jgi:hypothetical protein